MLTTITTEKYGKPFKGCGLLAVVSGNGTKLAAGIYCKLIGLLCLSDD